MEPSPFTAEFGRRVARRRRIVGLKQWQIAHHVGVHRSHIAQVERGTYKSMQLEQLAKLADILQTSADYLLQREDDPGVIPPRRCPGEERWLDAATLPLVTTHLERQEANAESIKPAYG